MLSRRSVRIKAMQFLFSMSRDKELTFKEAADRYWKSIDIAFELYLYNMYVLIGITECAVEDAVKRKVKHLPSTYDKNFSDKLFNNDLISFLKDSPNLQKAFTEKNFSALTNKDYYNKIYHSFAKTKEYTTFISTPSTREGDLAILLDLYRHCRKDELFAELMEDAYPQWIDDKSVVVGTMKKTLKEIPHDDQKFFDKYYPDDETVKEYGYELLKLTHENDEALLEHIKPTLKNWDHDRLAIIDTILLKMALVEFLHFPTIPTTVTLNEYLEVSKNYSTAKSKDFINGVLDNLREEFVEKEMIVKDHPEEKKSKSATKRAPKKEAPVDDKVEETVATEKTENSEKEVDQKEVKEKEVEEKEVEEVKPVRKLRPRKKKSDTEGSDK